MKKCPESTKLAVITSCSHNEHYPKADQQNQYLCISNLNYESGAFYASKENVLTGKVINQGSIWKDLDNKTFQDNANIAIHQFV